MSIRYDQVLPVDSATNALITETTETFYIHDGYGFETSISLTVAAGATGYVLLITGSSTRYIHLRDYALEATGAPATIIFYEGAAVSANGAPVSVINLNRSSTNTSIGTVYSGPTVTGTGTQLVKSIITGNKQDGGFGRSAAPKEIVLAASTNYLWAITNSTAGSVDFVLRPFWVEK